MSLYICYKFDSVWFEAVTIFLVQIMHKKTFAVTWERVGETSLGWKGAIASRAQRDPYAFSYKANEEPDIMVAQEVYGGRPIFQLDHGVCDPSNQILCLVKYKMCGSRVVLLLI